VLAAKAGGAPAKEIRVGAARSAAARNLFRRVGGVRQFLNFRASPRRRHDSLKPLPVALCASQRLKPLLEEALVG
jgi:hypothetical protein